MNKSSTNIDKGSFLPFRCSENSDNTKSQVSGIPASTIFNWREKDNSWSWGEDVLQTSPVDMLKIAGSALFQMNRSLFSMDVNHLVARHAKTAVNRILGDGL